MILVDDAAIRWRGRKWFHLMSDLEGAAGLAELHEFAERLGLKRSWFQSDKRLPHYDVVESKRAMAIYLGAEPVTSKEMVRRVLNIPKRKGAE